MTFNPQKPYNELLPLPPSIDVESKTVMRKAVSAGRMLAELKGLGVTIPNQSMLVNTLVLQEAQASSEIENIITTHDALFQALTSKNTGIDLATKEVFRYREALWDGFHVLKKKPLLNTELFIDLVQIIRENDLQIRNAPGTVVRNARTGEAVYTPPEGEGLIREKLADLERFIQAEEGMDPLIKMALIHYQFEAIHPFFDGNGRTGRIINILYLIQQRLLDLPVIYLSKYIIDNKPTYYRLLREVTENGNWEEWILFMLEAIEDMSLLTRVRIMAIRHLLEQTLEFARKELPSRVYSKELIELIFHQPYTKGQFIVDAGIAERQTAAEYLKELEKIGLLKSQKVGKENLYLNEKLYNILTK